MWFPTRPDINRPVQLQKQARSLKFWSYEEEELYYPSSENKGADQLRGYLICVFVFAYADCWFSHVAAHLSLLFQIVSFSSQVLHGVPVYGTTLQDYNKKTVNQRTVACQS